MTFLILNKAGWIESAEKIVSPNFDERQEDIKPSLIVIHNMSLPPGHFGNGAIADFFTNQLNINQDPYYAKIAQLRVSTHFFISRQGQLTQFVSTLQRAWHAGASVFLGRSACNDFSIGIELEGTDCVPFEKAQYELLTVLIHALIKHYPITAIVGHSDIAPGRKTDPGPFFDWEYLAHQFPSVLLRT